MEERERVAMHFAALLRDNLFLLYWAMLVMASLHAEGQKRWRAHFDRTNSTVEDFTLSLRGLPRSITSEAEVQQCLEKALGALGASLGGLSKRVDAGGRENGPEVGRGDRPKIWQSDSDEHRCTRCFSMHRSRTLRSRADPFHRPSLWAGSARDHEALLRRIAKLRLHRFLSESGHREAESSQVCAGDPPCRLRAHFSSSRRPHDGPL